MPFEQTIEWNYWINYSCDLELCLQFGWENFSTLMLDGFFDSLSWELQWIWLLGRIPILIPKSKPKKAISRSLSISSKLLPLNFIIIDCKTRKTIKTNINFLSSSTSITIYFTSLFFVISYIILFFYTKPYGYYCLVLNIQFFPKLVL